MKLGVLTSSRADYGIYKPLLDQLKVDSNISLCIIAFGMHLQHSQGYTLSLIESDNYENILAIGEMPEGDQVYDIAKGYAEILRDFTDFWHTQKFDLVLALGDRWEMSAAVQASIPFQVKIAHIHGGETTLGAIDNIYRHQITIVSRLHFTSNEEFSSRVEQITGSKEGVFTVGSISLDGLEKIKLPKWSKIQSQFQIPFLEFVLVTIHPETVLIDNNKEYALLAYHFLKKLAETKNVLITMSNSDALGSLFNQQFNRLQNEFPEKVKLVKALGKLNYFKAMQQCLFMVGNTSSGIIEAASFNKWVLNIGERQSGRLRSDNVIDVPFDLERINTAIKKLERLSTYTGVNKYKKANTCNLIINQIKKSNV